MIYLFDMLQRRIIVGSNFDLSLKKEDMKFNTVRRVIAQEKVQVREYYNHRPVILANMLVKLITNWNRNQKCIFKMYKT